MTERIPITPIAEEPIDYRARWMALALFVQNHFDTSDKTVKEIAADLSLAAYYAGID